MFIFYMIICTILSFVISWVLYNIAKKEDEAGQMLLGTSIGLFILCGLGGTLGIVVKTLGIWGNSW